MTRSCEEALMMSA